MDIMKKRISLILSVILLALVIVPIVNVNATSNTCQVSVETKMGSKKLKNASRYAVNGGEKVTISSSSTKAEIEYITHYFVTQDAETGTITKTEHYKDRNLKKVGTNNQGYGIYESTVIIPENPVGTLVNLLVLSVAANDNGSENTVTRTDWQKYTLEYVEKEALLDVCQVSVETKMDGKKLQNESMYEVGGGEKVTIRSSSTRAEISFITHYFVTKDAKTGKITKTEHYEDRNLKKVGTNSQGYGIYESTVIIPEKPVGTLVNLMVEPVAANDDGSENTITKTGWQKYTLEYIKEKVEDKYTKKLTVSFGTKILAEKSTTVLNAGDKIVVKATPADKVAYIMYVWNNGEVKMYSKDTLTLTIPSNMKAGTYKLVVNALYEDGLYVDNKVESSESQIYYFEVQGTSNTEYTKKLEVIYNGKTLANKSKTVVEAGDKIIVKATPSNKVLKMIYSWNGETMEDVVDDTFEFTIPSNIKAGTYKFVANALYQDGLYVDEKDEKNTVSQAYTFEIKDDTKPSNNRDLDIEPWMEENDETEELSISLRNDSEEENKANKNIYALNEVVTYYIDYKNGGKDIDDATITLELPIDFKTVDLDGGKINDDGEIEWTFEKGLEEDEAGTIIVKVKYTDLKKSRDDANTIYPTAKIYKGSKVKDVSTVINFIIRDYDEEIDIEHEPYMYGDADSDTFRPDYVITRAEGALVLARIYGLDYTKIKESEITTKYTDIDTTYFEAQQAITAASKAGLINGFLEDDGTYTYRPNTLMTKAQFMKILACMIQEGANDEDIDGLEIKGLENLVKIYDDAEKYYLVEGKRVYTHWAIEEITLLARLNMLPLTEDESYFKLDESITRAEVAQLINFYLLRAPAEVTSKTKTGFSDVSRKHKLVGDIVEATRKSHTFSITDEATEVEE